MVCSQFCKHHHLESVNVVQTVNNVLWLGFSFPQHFKVPCTTQLLILLMQYKYKRREHSLVTSKSHCHKTPTCKLAHIYNSYELIKLPAFRL